MTSDDPAVQRMKAAAVEAAARAYAPYSGFPVGASVLVEDGTIYAGANVENASFGLTMCAERNAVFQAIASGHRRIRAVAVFTPTGSPTPPCGACRQVVHEFGPTADVFCFAGEREALHLKLEELLPHAFGPESL